MISHVQSGTCFNSLSTVLSQLSCESSRARPSEFGLRLAGIIRLVASIGSTGNGQEAHFSPENHRPGKTTTQLSGLTRLLVVPMLSSGGKVSPRRRLLFATLYLVHRFRQR